MATIAVARPIKPIGRRDETLGHVEDSILLGFEEGDRGRPVSYVRATGTVYVNKAAVGYVGERARLALEHFYSPRTYYHWIRGVIVVVEGFAFLDKDD